MIKSAMDTTSYSTGMRFTGFKVCVLTTFFDTYQDTGVELKIRVLRNNGKGIRKINKIS